MKDKGMATLSFTKSADWLRSIEDRVLILHQQNPRKENPKYHPAQTVSFFGK